MKYYFDEINPREYLLQLDRLLGQVEVKGDSVIVLSDSRKLLKELYEKIKEEKEETSSDEKTEGG